MKSGESIGIDVGATVLGGIVFYGVYKKFIYDSDDEEYEKDLQKIEKFTGKKHVSSALDTVGGTRSTKKTHNNNNIKNTKHIKNIKKGTKKR